MLYTKENARANIRNKDGKRVFYLAEGDLLTSEARDYLNHERIEIIPACQAKPDRYRLLNGAELLEKPEHMTHLYDNVLVEKTHPRIAFRGAVDHLEAELLLCIRQVPELRKELTEVLELARKLIRWEVLNEPAEELRLCGLTEEELRQRSHFPQKFYGQPHFMPSGEDALGLLLINHARSAARSAELAAVRAFSDENGNLQRRDLIKVLNRMSSMLYILMIRLKASTPEKG